MLFALQLFHSWTWTRLSCESCSLITTLYLPSKGLVKQNWLHTLCRLCISFISFSREGFFERCVMNNYFGIGIDAKISLDFHHKREEHPEKCRSRARNYMWYGVLGSKEWLQVSQYILCDMTTTE